MQNVRFIFLFVLLAFAAAGNGQSPDVIQNYIDTYKETAIAEIRAAGPAAFRGAADRLHELQLSP